MGHRNRITPPYGEITRSAAGRAGRGVRPYGGLQEVRWSGQTWGRPPLRNDKRRGWSWHAVYAYIRIYTIYTRKSLAEFAARRRQKNFKSFFTATCAWGKIPLRLPVWNFVACDKIMRAADCKPLWQKIPAEFSASKKRDARRRLFSVVCRLYLTCRPWPCWPRPFRRRYRRASWTPQP